MSGATQTVEMGETWVSNTGADRLMAHGLGACIGLCLYDARARLAAMVHVVLPETMPAKSFAANPQPFPTLPGKCADTAVRHVIDQIVREGANPHGLRAAIAGGAQIFSHASGTPNSIALSRLEIGPRNVQAVRDALETEHIPLVAEDIGGSYGRNLTFCVGSGEVYVRRIGSEEQLLALLGQEINDTTTSTKEATANGL